MLTVLTKLVLILVKQRCPVGNVVVPNRETPHLFYRSGLPAITKPMFD